MRTENPSSLAAILARVRSRLARAGRSAWARGPVVRWGAAAVVLTALVGFGYLATMPSAGKFLSGGQQYLPQDVVKITRALDAAGIDYRVESRRIGVSTDHFEEAMGVVAKLDLGPRSPGEFRKRGRDSGLWDSIVDKEQRALLAKEESLEAMIRELDGIVSAYVTINRARARVRNGPAATAFVWLETDEDRELPPRTIQTIQNMIVGNEPELKPETVSIFDKKGHQYPVPNANTSRQVREEDLAQKILDELPWVKGVRVTVQIVAAPPPPPVSAPRHPAAAPVAKTARPDADETRVGVNQPLALESEPEPDPIPPPPSPPLPPPKPVVEAEMARVWVQVPRSFYYRKALPNRDPSAEDLVPIVERTKALITTAVGHVIPPGELGKVEIDTIPDDVVLKSPLMAPTVPETHRPPSWWIPAGVGGAVMGTLLIVVFRLLAVRRPKAVAVVEREPSRFTREPASESVRGPTERVRELIRRNPEAAAGVLHRWIGQGGSLG